MGSGKATERDLYYLLLAEPNWKYPEGKGTKSLRSFQVKPSSAQSRMKGRKCIWLDKQQVQYKIFLKHLIVIIVYLIRHGSKGYLMG